MALMIGGIQIAAFFRSRCRAGWVDVCFCTFAVEGLAFPAHEPYRVATLTVSPVTANITTIAHQCLHRAPPEVVSCSISRRDTLLVVTYRTHLWQATASGITRVTALLRLLCRCGNMGYSAKQLGQPNLP